MPTADEVRGIENVSRETRPGGVSRETSERSRTGGGPAYVHRHPTGGRGRGGDLRRAARYCATLRGALGGRRGGTRTAGSARDGPPLGAPPAQLRGGGRV